jgi:hypothetical protein
MGDTVIPTLPHHSTRVDGAKRDEDPVYFSVVTSFNSSSSFCLAERTNIENDNSSYSPLTPYILANVAWASTTSSMSSSLALGNYRVINALASVRISFFDHRLRISSKMFGGRKLCRVLRSGSGIADRSRRSLKVKAYGDILPPFGLPNEAAAWISQVKWPLQKMVIGNVATAWTFQDGWIIVAYALLIRPTLVMTYSMCSTILAPNTAHVKADHDDGSTKGRTWTALIKTVLWNTEAFKSSWSHHLYQPLQLLSVPIIANYMFDMALNFIFTYKLVNKGQLLKMATIADEVIVVAS